MADTTTTHGVSTTLPDDLWEMFVAEAAEEDRNWSAHLRRIVKDHFRRQNLERSRRNLVDEVRPTIDPHGGSITVPRDDTVHRPWNDR